MRISAHILRRRDTQIGVLASLFLTLASYFGVLPFGMIEVFGFVSGAASVWLLVKENIWNWPIGIINAVFFLVLFAQYRLFADSGLQVFYIVVGVWGWWFWLHGGEEHSRRKIGHVPFREALIVGALVAAATYGMMLYLRSVGDTAPFLDGLTTAMSLGAFFLQARKWVENWWVWIAADVIYIPLYFYKGLPLTGILYIVFMAMCVRGLVDWKKSIAAREPVEHWHRAVVCGKFYPFHSGHRHLIETALARADEVTVMVCKQAGQLIPAETRKQWIEKIVPDARVLVFDQEAAGLDDRDSKAWAAATIEFLGFTPDVVVTSEAYGKPWSAALGAAHLQVDKARETFPISGTQIRERPLANFGYLAAPARAHFAKRVCVLGAESTGKTTIARALAEHYETVWAPEYGHPYTAFGRDAGPEWETWKSEEFVHIARMQNWLEDFQAQFANRLLICDTNAHVTALFHEVYLGGKDAECEALAASRSYDLYLICDPETPFQQDEMSLRTDGPHRLAMHERYVEDVQALGADYVILAGSHLARMRAACQAIDQLLAVDMPVERGREVALLA